MGEPSGLRLTAPQREASVRYTRSNVERRPDTQWQRSRGCGRHASVTAAKTPAPMATGQTKSRLRLTTPQREASVRYTRSNVEQRPETQWQRSRGCGRHASV